MNLIVLQLEYQPERRETVAILVSKSFNILVMHLSMLDLIKGF